MNNKSKIKKAMLSCAVVFILFSQQLFSEQKASDKENATAESQSTILTETDEQKLPITTGAGNTNVSGMTTVNSAWVFIRMILVLALVILIIWLIFKMMKKGMKPGEENDPFLRKVASITLSPGKSIQIVTCIDHAYIVGVSDDSVSLISTLDDKELVDAMNLYADKNQNKKKPLNFADVLDLFMPHGPRTKPEEKNQKKKSENIFSGSSQDVVEMLKKQRERLNKDEDVK